MERMTWLVRSNREEEDFVVAVVTLVITVLWDGLVFSFCDSGVDPRPAY